MAKKQKYKFVAKPALQVEEVKEEIVEIQPIELNDNQYSFDNTFELADMSLLDLSKDIAKSVHKGFKFFLFTQARENKKIALKLEHIKLLQNILQETKALGREIMNLKAEAIINVEILDQIIEGKKIDLKHEIKLKLEQYKTQIKEEQIKREKQEIELLDLKADIALKQAMASFKEAESEEQKQNAMFMKNVNEDFLNLPTGAKIVMFHDYMNRHKNDANASEIKDFDYEDFLKEISKKFYKESLNQAKAKTMSEEAIAEHDRWRTDKKQGKI